MNTDSSKHIKVVAIVAMIVTAILALTVLLMRKGTKEDDFLTDSMDDFDDELTIDEEDDYDVEDDTDVDEAPKQVEAPCDAMTNA